jgi:kynurenine formamidase
MSAVDPAAYMSRLSNWGRWGEDDMLGTLNNITPASRLAATGMVREGLAISLARTISPKYDSENQQPMLHHMLASGEAAPDQGMGVASDWIGLAPHGYAMTHLDSHSHIFWEGKMYNGRSAKLVRTTTGGKFGSVEAAARGILTRGVLLDLPRSLGREWLNAGEAIVPGEINNCLAAQKTSVAPGDFVLVRTGRDPRTRATGLSDPEKEGTAGLHATCAEWLRETDIAALGSDSVNDVIPSGIPGFFMPIHIVGLVAMGLWLLDNAYLEELADACAERNRWEFLITLAPLLLKNATGSPVNPIAVL